MRGLGPSIDLGSLFSELMDGMENNSLSCLTASLLLTAQRRGGRLSLATRLRLTTALEDSEAGDRDGPLAPGQGPAPPVPQDLVTVTARGMGRTGMHRDVPQGLTARSSGRSPRENPGSPGWPQPVYLGGAPQTVRPGDGSSHLCSPGPLGNVHPLFQHPINHRLLFLIRLLLTHPHCPAGDGAQPQVGAQQGLGCGAAQGCGTWAGVKLGIVWGRGLWGEVWQECGVNYGGWDEEWGGARNVKGCGIENGHGEWIWGMNMGNGHGEWIWGMDMGNGHGEWIWRIGMGMDMGNGHGMWHSGHSAEHPSRSCQPRAGPAPPRGADQGWPGRIGVGTASGS